MFSLLRSLFLAGLTFTLTAPAFSADILQASVAVDVTAQNTSAAREKALGEGQQQAFRRLLESMTVEADRGRLPHPANWQEWVIDFSVDQEKTTPVRYLATLSVRFKAQPVRNLLRQAGISYAETVSKPVLVVPVLAQSGRGLLWDEDNGWLKAWQERPKLSSLAPVLTPMGDSWDRQAYDVGLDRERLETLGRRYGAAQTLLAEARVSPTGIDIRLIHPNGQAALLTVANAKDQAQPPYRRAADAVALQIEESWKRANLVSHDSLGALVVTVSFNGMAEWLKIREKLERVSLIRRQDMLELARNRASLALHHSGDFAQLRTALSQADLNLSADGQGGHSLALMPAR
ncbi:conserved exported hypothetical protein [Rhodospirillaceae bacterium LM-1]|nr:conserved exported hypothetical protein [Rhodospirillaceae bacterium LM-1]